MPSRCTLGGDAGLLLDRSQEPVLPEYTCNVIRKCNTKIDLMCPFVIASVFAYLPGEGADMPEYPDFIGW